METDASPAWRVQKLAARDEDPHVRRVVSPDLWRRIPFRKLGQKSLDAGNSSDAFPSNVAYFVTRRWAVIQSLALSAGKILLVEALVPITVMLPIRLAVCRCSGPPKNLGRSEGDPTLSIAVRLCLATALIRLRRSS